MIAFLVGLLLLAVIVIGIIYSDNEKFKIENKEMNKIGIIFFPIEFIK